MKKIDLVGERFGRLLVIEFKDVLKGRTRWLCQCDCGQIKILVGHDIKNGDTKSCGCLEKENRYRHGMCYSRFYKIFSHIKDRCLNKKNKNFKHYGGRDIKCLWKSFIEFKKDMYKSYLEHVKEFGDKNTSIDRIDNNRGYFKENCKWATQKEQCNNTRRNKLITFNGEILNLSQWAKKLGLNINCLDGRLKKWPLERALTEPINKSYQRLK